MPQFNPSTRLKNQKYLDLLNQRPFTPITEEDITIVLQNIDRTCKRNRREEAKALVIILFYTGCRPAEALNLKGKDVVLSGTNVMIYIDTLKHGKPRTIPLPLRKPFVKECMDYIKKIYPELYLFRHFRSESKRYHKTQDKLDHKGNIIKKGELIEYTEVSCRLRYHFKKWFKHLDIPPYFLRHNRFSLMSMKGGTETDIKLYKGSTSTASVHPYLHISKERISKFSRLL